jgi:hypothetical protein
MTLPNIKKVHINFATKVNIKAQRGAKCAHRRVGNMPKRIEFPQRRNQKPTQKEPKTNKRNPNLTKNKLRIPKGNPNEDKE